jgi:hypothetical protein
MFEGLSTDSKNRFRQHVVEQLGAAAGGPCVYTGRSMKTAHAGIGADGTAAVGRLAATLDTYKVPEKGKGELPGPARPDEGRHRREAIESTPGNSARRAAPPPHPKGAIRGASEPPRSVYLRSWCCRRWVLRSSRWARTVITCMPISGLLRTSSRKSWEEIL